MSKWFVVLVFVVICFIGSLVTWYYNAIWLPGFTDYPAAYGQMGDFFGGLLNPILAFASFMALLYTIKIQSDALNISNHEVRNSESHRNSERIVQSAMALYSSVEGYISQCESVLAADVQLTISGGQQPLEKIISKYGHHNSFIRTIRLIQAIDLNSIQQLQQPEQIWGALNNLNSRYTVVLDYLDCFYKLMDKSGEIELGKTLLNLYLRRCGEIASKLQLTEQRDVIGEGISGDFFKKEISRYVESLLKAPVDISPQ